MYVFVVTGRAGDHLWPAKVFTGDAEMPAKIFVDIAGNIANACRENLRLFQSSDLWAKMNLKERHDCEKVISAGIDGMDPEALSSGNLTQSISYVYTRVAIHD